MNQPKRPIRIATTSLAGCFGCHMSLLDIDEKLIDLVELIEFDRSPLTDIKVVGDCDIGIVEGGLANDENVEVLREFRKHCRILIAMGACALNGGVPALRNHFSVEQILKESYIDGIGVDNPHIPSDKELPRLLNRVLPIHQAVRVDCMLPGCPPRAEEIWAVIYALLQGREPQLPPELVNYD
jgi:NAD-reducing hydrogenase small subunit